MKRKPKILLLYKKSVYDLYFKSRKIPLDSMSKASIKKRIKDFKISHDIHYETLMHVEKILSDYDCDYVKRVRGSKITYQDFDYIFTLGGDGTFLEASKHIDKQIILGINSNPLYSIGKLCLANSKNFDSIVKKMLTQKSSIRKTHRLSIKVSNHKNPFFATNDILFAHNNPAAMSRYQIKIGSLEEEHRNSGLWISSAIGSSGAIKSAGGKLLRWDQNKFQYYPRELYKQFNKHYQFMGGVLQGDHKIKITSLIRNASLYIDGAHQKVALNYGATFIITLSKNPLKMLSS